MSAFDAAVLLVADGMVAVGRVLGGLRARCAAEKHADAVDALNVLEDSQDGLEPGQLVRHSLSDNGPIIECSCGRWFSTDHAARNHVETPSRRAMSDMSGETDDSDFFGIVLNAAVAAMDGCPWVQKGRVLEVADGIAEVVADRLGRVSSVFLPGGERFTRPIEDVGLQAKHSEWVASLKASDDVASVVALAVLDDFARLIFPDCQHDWRTFEDEAVKTSGDQEWTCALCGETRIVNPPVKAVQDDDDCSHCAPTAMSAVGDSSAAVSTPAADNTTDVDHLEAAYNYHRPQANYNGELVWGCEGCNWSGPTIQAHSRHRFHVLADMKNATHRVQEQLGGAS